MIGARFRQGSNIVEVNDPAAGIWIEEGYTPRVATSTAPDATVSDSARIHVTVRATGEQLKVLLERLFEAARTRHRLDAGERVYFEFRQSEWRPWRRSELRLPERAKPDDVVGSVDVNDDALSAPGREYWIRLTVAWTRRWYLEASEETEIPLTNAGIVSKRTGGIQVQNHNDAGDYNYIEIEHEDVTGGPAAPVRLEIENDNLVNKIARLYIGHSAVNTTDLPYSTYSHIREESAIFGGASGQVSNKADVNCSSALYSEISWVATGEQNIAYYVLPVDLRTVGAGKRYRILARFRGAPQENVWVQYQVAAGIVISDTIILSESGRVRLATDRLLQDIVSIQMPKQAGDGSRTPANIYLHLNAEKVGSIGTAATISNIVGNGTTTTVTTAAAHGYSNGNRVRVTGTTNYNSNASGSISVLSSTQFEYSSTVSAAAETAGTVTTAGVLEVDFIQLTPVDGWRVHETDIYIGATLYDDMPEENAWQELTGGTGVLSIAPPRGKPILLVPNTTQRIYFLAGHEPLGAGPELSEIEHELTVKAFYRPRFTF